MPGNGNGDETQPRSGTTASIDRRVERLEQAQAETSRAVDRLELGQANMKEVMDLRFKGIETQIQATDLRVVTIGLKFDGLNDWLQKSMADAMKMSGDVEATPAGRVIAGEIKELEAGRQKNADAISDLRGKFLMISGALAVLITLMNLLAPNIRELLRLSGN